MSWIRRHKKLCIFLVISVLFLGWRRYDGNFTPERWAETDISHRGKLVDSLLKQYDGLVGMTRAEVEELLQSDMEGKQMEERLDGRQTPMLVYPIGGRPWAAFPEYLFIYLENDRVTEARIVAD